MYQKNIIKRKKKRKTIGKNRNKNINIADFRMLNKVVIENYNNRNIKTV